MNRFVLILVNSFLLCVLSNVNAQETLSTEELQLIDKAIGVDIGKQEDQGGVSQSREMLLWNQLERDETVENLSAYLNEFPEGKYVNEVNSKLEALKIVARVQAEDKELEAYRKRRINNGLILELDSALKDVRPYVRSMINTCGYTVVDSHRFAKRVYPTLVVGGKLYKSRQDAEYVVMLDLSLVLKSHTREIKKRQKMRSYRTSEIDSHKALFAAFEDVGAQMKSADYCPSAS